MIDEQGKQKQDLFLDGIHPNNAGYSVMDKLQKDLKF
jgi:lysophospholipase L1-like esterase